MADWKVKTIEELENTPSFAELTYNEQLKLRTEFLMDTFKNNQNFIALKPEEQKQVFEGLLFRPPKFEQATDIFGRKVGTYAWMTPEQLQEEGKKLLTPEALGGKGTTGGLSRLAGGVFSPEGAGIFNEVKKLATRLVQGEATNRNDAKTSEWLRLLQNRDARWTTAGNILQTAGTIVGFAAETIPFYSTLVGSFSAPQGVAKLLMKIPETFKTRWPHLLYLGARAGAHAIGGGFAGIVRENIRDLVQGNLENASFGDIALKSAKYFGDYALGDLIGFAIGGFFKRAGTALKWTFKGAPGKGQLLSSLGLTKDFNTVLVDALSGKGLDKAFAKKLGDPVFETFLKNCDAYGRVLKNVEAPKLDDLVQAVGAANGFATKIDKGKYEVTEQLTGKSLQTFSNADDTLKFLEKEISKLPKQSVKEQKIMGVGTQKIELTQIVRKYLPENSKGVEKLLATTIAPLGGNFDPRNVRTFTRELLKINGADDKIANSILTKIDNGKIQILSEGQLIHELPVNVTNPLDEKRVINELSQKLGELIPEGAITKEASTNLSNTYTELIKKARVHYTPSWVQDTVINDLNGTLTQIDPKTFQLELPTQNINKIFSSWDDAANYILKERLFDEKMYASYLNTYRGLKLEKVQNGYYVRKQGKKIAEGATIKDIMDAYPDLTPKIPAQYGPQFTFIVDDAKTGIQYENKVAVGTAETLREELSKFRDYSKDFFESKARFGDKLKYNEITKTYEVFFPDLNLRKTFKNEKEAAKFLLQGSNDFDVLTYGANIKGYKLDVYNGQWRVYTEGRVSIFKTQEDLKNFLRNAPSPEFAPELTGLQEEFFKDFKEIPGLGMKDRSWKVNEELPVQMSGAWTTQNWMRPVEASLEAAIKKGAPEYMLKTFRRIEQARSKVSLTIAAACNVVEDAFKINGKIPNVKIRRRIAELLKNDLEKPGITQIVQDLNLKPEHLTIAKNIRGMFDTLAELYQINPDKFLKEYLPRMRRYASSLEVVNLLDSDIQKFLGASMEGNIPTDLEATFRHARVSDVLSFIAEDDPLNMLRRYVAMGQKEKHFGPLLKDYMSWHATNRKVIPPQLDTRFLAYLQDFLGVPTSMSDKLIRQSSQALFQKLGLKNPPANILDSVIQLGYASSLAFRPYTAIRNLFQPFQTLGIRIGNSYISDAMRALANDADGKIYQRLLKTGALQIDYPFYQSGEILGSGGFLAKTTELGTKWIKNSDDWNRAVSYLACEMRFDDALQKFQYKNPNFHTNEKLLMAFVDNNSGMWNLADDLKTAGIQQLKEGNFEGAKSLFASKLTDETQFIYRKGLGPLPFRGSLGKVFGQYGTYAVNYVQNLRNAFSRAKTPLQKLAVAGRVAGNSAALIGAFSYLGMRAEDFAPWGPLGFSGGQYYKLMNTFLQAMNFQSYEGRIARTKLTGISIGENGLKVDFNSLMNSELFHSLVPGSLAMRSFTKAIEYLNEGDYYKFMLSLTSAPMAPDD